LKYTTRKADIYTYDTSIKPIENIRIVTGATAYNDDMTGQTCILVFNKSLYYGLNLDHTLINPNKVCHYGIQFNDNPYDKGNGIHIEINDELIYLQSLVPKFDSKRESQLRKS